MQRTTFEPARCASALSVLLLGVGSSVVLLCLSACGGGAQTTVVKVQPIAASITISPGTASAPAGTRQQFTAIVAHSSSSVTWSAAEGAIDQTGLYVAPQPLGNTTSATITARLADTPNISATATVALTNGSVAISVLPASAKVKAGFTQLFTASVSGTTELATTWAASASPGDSTFPGSISGGLYTAPAPVFGTQNYSVSVTSFADPGKSATADVTVVPLDNQVAQAFPVKLGTSGGNATVGDCCSGTLGSLLQDQNGKQYILSNNHVIGKLGTAVTGEGVTQPGGVDALCDLSKTKTVAHFTAAPDIHTSNVDAAIAEVVPGAVDPQGEIIGLGGTAPDGTAMAATPASATASAALNMVVAKSGRTTGLTCAPVVGLFATAIISEGPICGNTTPLSITYFNQIVMTNLVSPGDSGSLILDAATARPVALISGASSTYSVANPIADVLSELNATTGLTLTFVGGAQHEIPCSSANSFAQTRLNAALLRTPAAQILSSARAAKETYEQELQRDPAVLAVAVGSGDDSPAGASILVFVEANKHHAPVPVTLDGIPVRIIETERFTSGPVSHGTTVCLAPNNRVREGSGVSH